MRLKKLTTLLLTILLLATPMLAEEMEIEETEGTTRRGDIGSNLLKNSDMSLGNSGWGGDRTFTKDGDNPVLAVKASSNRRVFFQEFSTHRATDLEITFKYKTADYKGGRLTTSIAYGGSSRGRIIDLKADNEWHKMTWQFNDVKDRTRLVLRFTVDEGEGTVFFDDITVVSVSKK